MGSLFGPFRRIFRWIGKLLRSRWGGGILIFFGIIAVSVAIWFGFPMTGWAPITSVSARLIAIGVFLSVIALIYGLAWFRRRKKAQTFEDSLLSEPQGDGKVLAESMGRALETLKKSGGRNYLYDLPWYLIIGPPGAGKTTALRNSGIEFPGLDAVPDKGAGFGGTRHCDWWFAEDAVLIDTAGRYTTHESDKASDAVSWSAFLDLLKSGRPDQPINGVILAFSVEQILGSSAEDLRAHAQTVRERLGEIHDHLKIDFPVYVLFTKVDLIAGFRDYFATFSAARRQQVWGVTFQSRDPKEETYSQVESEFSSLVSRLSDEIIDRMNEEPDGVSRIAIFGLPGQISLMQANVSEFLRQVFEPTRYKTNAILRGFYFTSGTQEGTPIDQVLGAMAANQGGVEFQPAFLSGKGKSYFLHDLLKKVIFEERDWVGFDIKALRRAALRRTVGIVGLLGVTASLIAAFGVSYWLNSKLLSEAERDTVAYMRSAAPEIARPVIESPETIGILPYLQEMRSVTAGYGDTRTPTFWEGFGLSRRSDVSLASDQAYSDALERMLRPRMILQLENAIPQMIVNEDTSEIYRALKTYLLLGGQREGRNDDSAIRAYFEDVWRAEYNGPSLRDDLDRLMAHLDAMLELDGDRTPMLAIDPEIVSDAREAIVNLPLADQAYASIKDRAANIGPVDFNLIERVGAPGERVFETVDGSPITTVGVPGLFTFEGYWGFFLEELAAARERLDDDQWVLGSAAPRVGYEQQLRNLERDLHRAYRIEFNAAWREMFALIELAPMSNDAPRYETLAAAASPVASPILELVEAVDEQTRLSRLYDEIADLSPEAIATGSVGDAMGDAVFQRIYSQSGVFQRVVLDNVQNRAKVQSRAGNAAAEDTQAQMVERLSDDFADWHEMMRGPDRERAIDVVLANLADLREIRRRAASSPNPADEVLLSQSLSTLTMNNTSLPAPLGQMLNEIENEYRAVASEATMSRLNRALNEEITQYCRDLVAPLFPFGEGRHISPAVFGQFFGPGGRMDTFYSTYLQPHVIRGPNGLEPAPDSAIAQNLSRGTLRQFDRAQAIQLAFFAGGSNTPQVDMSLTHQSSSPTVQLAIITINGNTARTQPDSFPVAMTWPGQSSGVGIELFPQADDRVSSLSFNQGRWDIVEFLRSGRTRVNTNIAEVTHEIGGRSITYRVEFDSTTVPFLMPELSEFTCPASME